LYDLITKVFTNSSKPSLLKGNSLLKNKDNLSVSVIIIFIVVSAVRQNCHQRQTVKKPHNPVNKYSKILVRKTHILYF
jgi:hypothetical protein